MRSNQDSAFPEVGAGVTFRQRAAFLWRYLKAYPVALGCGIVSLICRNGVSFAIPLLIRSGINVLTSRHAVGISPIVHIALGIAGVALLSATFQALGRLNVIGMSRHIEYEMRKDFLTHLFRLDASFWGRTRTGDVMALATNDLNAIRMMLGPGMISFFECMVQLPVAILVLASFNWKLTLAALLPAPFAVLIIVIFGRITRIRFEKIQALFSTMSAAVQQTIAGARVVRSFVREQAEQGRFEQMNQSYLRANCVLGIYSSTFDPLLTFTTGISVLIVLWYGGSLMVAHQLQVGDFVMFTTYMAMLAQPIASLGRIVNMMQRGMASTSRLQLLFDETPAIQPGRWLQSGENRRDTTGSGSITLRQVSVFFGSYAALDSIDLNISAGSTVAILGETGSGKSTLVKLVTRTIDPSEGSVHFDGIDCREVSLSALRSRVGVVPQETFLFSHTLAANIGLGVDDASEEEIADAAIVAGLGPDLEALPAGFDTIVGERGIMLSGGQKQRIAIARAVLKNPRILVLDDALSSVDSDTEQRILDHLTSIMAERTTILITHRVATAMRADHIVVLRNGRIVEQGTHCGLIERGGQYARLARLQVLEEELETL